MEAIVIGTGFGEHVMAPAFARAGINPTVVSPRDREAVESALDGPVDLVSVHSPPFLHSEHVSMALDRGIPVLCDKPFCRNAQEARDLRDRANRLGILHFVNFELRWKPGRVRLKALLDRGEIGSLQHVSWSMFGNGLRRQKHGWLFDADQAGGWIGAYGGHMIDALRWLTGSEITRCGGISRIDIASRPDRQGVEQACSAEDGFSAWFELGNGCTVNCDTSYSVSVDMPERLVLFGSEGALELVDDRILTILRPGRATEVIEVSPPDADSYALSLDPWLSSIRDAISDGHQIAPNFDDGVATAEVMDRLLTSITRAQ